MPRTDPGVTRYQMYTPDLGLHHGSGVAWLFNRIRDHATWVVVVGGDYRPVLTCPSTGPKRYGQETNGEH